MATVNRDRNQLLRRIMEKTGLSKEETSKRLGVSVEQLDKWLASPEDSAYEEIPEPDIQFLMYETNFDIYEVYD